MFSSKKSKLMWHKIKNKKTLVLHLSNIYELTYLTPKISGPFWWILGVKYVLIDMWANDQNEMMLFYFQP
jgi:hypothetical protein